MRGLFAFLHKELLEAHRSFRAWILTFAFVFVGLGSPLTAKLTPLLLEKLATDETGGMSIVVNRAPSAFDALFQFQKNYALLPVLVIVMFAGAVCRETRGGEAALVLTKPVGRRAFLLAKLLVGAGLLVVGTVVATAGCALYTSILFESASLDDLVPMAGLLLLHLVFHVVLTLTTSVMARSTVPAIGMALLGYVVVTVVAALPRVGVYSPGHLSAAATSLLLDRPPDVVPSLVVTLGLTALLAVVGDRVLARQEL